MTCQKHRFQNQTNDETTNSSKRIPILSQFQNPLTTSPKKSFAIFVVSWNSIVIFLLSCLLCPASLQRLSHSLKNFLLFVILNLQLNTILRFVPADILNSRGIHTQSDNCSKIGWFFFEVKNIAKGLELIMLAQLTCHYPSGFSFVLVHNCTIYLCPFGVGNIDEQCRGPSKKEKDPLAGYN